MPITPAAISGRAMEHRLAQETILRDLLAADPKNKARMKDWIGQQRGRALIRARSRSR